MRCRAALASAADGRAALLDVVGEPGIGKTALLAEVAASEPRFLTLRVTGVPAESVIAYAGVEVLIRPVADRIAALPADAQRALAGALRNLGSAMPEPLPVAGALLALLAAVSADQPVLVSIDDAQWLDEPSRQVFAAIGRRLGGERVAMFVASRDVRESGPDAQPICLDAFAANESRQLLRERHPALSADIADTLHRRAAGNPLCLVEVADELTPAQLSGRAPLPGDEYVPQRIRAAHLARIDAVSRSARLLLVIAACAGRSELPIVLSAFRAVDPDEDGMSALDELLAADLVRIDGTQAVLRHPLLRSSTAERAGSSGLRRAHEGLCVALSATDPDRALWHRAAAQPEYDEDLAAELADFAQRLTARAQPDSARQALQRAAELTADPERRRERLVCAAEISLRGTSGAQTAALIAELAAMPALSAGHRQRVRVVEAWTEVRLGHRARAAAGLLAAAADMSSARTDLLADAVAAAVEDGDHETARQGVDMLVDDGRSATGPNTGIDGGETDVDFVALADAAIDYLSRPRQASLPAALRAAIDCWPTTSHVASLSIMRDTALQSGELEQGRSIATAMLDVARESGDVSAMASATLTLAFCDHALTNWNSAAARAFEATQLVDESAAPVVVADALLLLVDIDASRGQAAACQAGCVRVRRLAEQLADPGYAVLADRREALLHIPGNDPSAARHILESALRRFRRAGMSHPFFSPVPDLIEVLLRVGRRDEAEALAPEFLDLVGDDAPDPPRARALRVRGLLAGAEDYDSLFDRSVAADEASGQLFHAARTRLCQAERRRRDGRRVDARDRLEQALRTFRGVEATPWIARAERELAAAGGAPAAASTPAVTQNLTHQELQIATKVAEGHRNTDIAAALYLSTKTVEFHLTRVYRKAGVTNRTQLAAVMSHPGADRTDG